MTCVLMSLHPKWCSLILSGEKTIEVRKRAPRLETPFRIYLYCTKPKPKDSSEYLDIHYADGNIRLGNGMVCGCVTCTEIVEVTPPYRNRTEGTCLTAKELYEYHGTSDKLYFMKLENPYMFKKPYTLEEIGVERPPQSWQYVRGCVVSALATANRYGDDILNTLREVREGSEVCGRLF